MMKTIQLFAFLILCHILFSCSTPTPKGLLKLPDDTLAKRQLQMRQYDTNDEQKILSSVAGIYQDLGFTLEDSQTELGLVVATKKADATVKGTLIAAVLLDVLSALAGTYSNATGDTDDEQQLKASAVVKPNIDRNKMVVRVTFQRIVWNRNRQVSRVETISDPSVYEKFFDGLSKAIFLEAQQI